MRVLHISDLHIRLHLEGTSDKPERQSRKAPSLLQCLSREIPMLSPDLVVITGDLLDVPKPLLRGEIADPIARAAIVAAAIADYRFVRAWLESSGIPFVALPGNHDVLELFEKAFDDQPNEIELLGTRIIAFHDWEQAGNIPQRLASQRKLFDRAMSDNDDRPQVHLQHFLLRPSLQESYPYNYIDANAMAKTIEESGRVIAVLAGHYHRGAFIQHTSGVHYSVVPAFCVAPYPYRIMDIGRDRTVIYRDVALEEAHGAVSHDRGMDGGFVAKVKP